MSLSKFNENMNNISSLANKPALSAEELKREFDEAGNDVKDFLNNTLTEELDKILENKVEKEDGKEMISTEQLNQILSKLINIATKTDITNLQSQINNKVGKVDGKDLILTTLITKLNGIATGATKNIINYGTAAPSGGNNGDIYIQYF